MPIPALIPLAMAAAKTIGAKLAAKTAAKAATSAVAKNVGAKMGSDMVTNSLTTAAKNQVNPAAVAKRSADIAKSVGQGVAGSNEPASNEADTTPKTSTLDALSTAASGIAMHHKLVDKFVNPKNEPLKEALKWGPLGLIKGYNDKAKRIASQEQAELNRYALQDGQKAAAQINRDAQMMNAATANIQPPTPSFTQGGNVTARSKSIAMYREGGTLHLENVIVDGPSHEEENETGVVGDKGIPVVKDGVKIAEIESKELVLNENASDELVGLYKEYQKQPSEELLHKIAALMDYELKHNTYDYTKELLS
jgi:hypothetical protein